MKRVILALAGCLLSGATPIVAQSLDDLNIQLHGFATQGFLYTTNNNFLTTNSSDGSSAWTEAVVNLSSQPIPKLRVAVQARYELLGNLSNGITIDYAMADYKQNEFLGVRFGKVKVPSGLFNETSDIDPAYIWSLLPESIYAIASRNSQLSLFGGVAYGAVSLSKAGKLEYRGWAGTDDLTSTDGYFLPFRNVGLNFPNGLSGQIEGVALKWKTPLSGLLVGTSVIYNNARTTVATAGNGALIGKLTVNAIFEPDYFAIYEKNKVMVATEYRRIPVNPVFFLPGLPPDPATFDLREFYGMGSYKLTDKITAGAYYSQVFNVLAPLGPARYQKDWALSARYDFNQFLYAKAEQHFMDGTQQGYDTTLNPDGLKCLRESSSRLLISTVELSEKRVCLDSSLTFLSSRIFCLRVLRMS